MAPLLGLIYMEERVRCGHLGCSDWPLMQIELAPSQSNPSLRLAAFTLTAARLLHFWDLFDAAKMKRNGAPYMEASTIRSPQGEGRHSYGRIGYKNLPSEHSPVHRCIWPCEGRIKSDAPIGAKVAKSNG